MIIEFNDHKSSAVKLISVKNESVIKCTTRFMSGKLLMFAKLSLKSFIYTLVEKKIQWLQLFIKNIKLMRFSAIKF